MKQNNLFYIIEYDNVPSGYVRFQESNENREKLVLSIAIDSTVRGHGLGLFAVKEACTKVLMILKVNIIIALVKNENIASINLFQRACFTRKPFHCYQDTKDVEVFYYPNYIE